MGLGVVIGRQLYPQFLERLVLRLGNTLFVWNALAITPSATNSHTCAMQMNYQC